MLRAMDATRQRSTVFAAELLLYSFPSADSAFRFAVAAAFDIVAEEQGVLVGRLRPSDPVLAGLVRLIRDRYSRAYVRARDPWTQASDDSRTIWYVFRGE